VVRGANKTLHGDLHTKPVEIAQRHSWMLWDVCVSSRKGIIGVTTSHGVSVLQKQRCTSCRPGNNLCGELFFTFAYLNWKSLLDDLLAPTVKKNIG